MRIDRAILIVLNSFGISLAPSVSHFGNEGACTDVSKHIDFNLSHQNHLKIGKYHFPYHLPSN